jgi:hypothetical protein
MSKFRPSGMALHDAREFWVTQAADVVCFKHNKIAAELIYFYIYVRNDAFVTNKVLLTESTN